MNIEEREIPSMFGSNARFVPPPRRFIEGVLEFLKILWTGGRPTVLETSPHGSNMPPQNWYTIYM
jgi:hypothetical protein